MLGRVLLPLRAFLGFTFCFAGLQKLANPQFFNAASPVSIQAQLAGAARRSPIHLLISPLTHVAVPLGIIIALGELAVGVGTLLGLRARVAAAGGLALSLMLFLTVSFHSAPYYTGADIVFAFAWTPLLLAGSGSVLALDAVLKDRAQRQAATPQDRARAGRAGTAGPEIRRREAVLGGVITAAAAAATLAIAGLAAGLGRLVNGTAGQGKELSLPSVTGSGSGTSPAAGTASPSATRSGPAAAGPAPAGTASAGTAIGPATEVPVGQAAAFTDPATGDPSIVIHASPGKFLAFDAVCPHAGCTVGYDSGTGIIVCPCHGSQFNATTGAVEVGPAPTGLKKIPITEGLGGQLYVT
jgi:thiosulfate dehydrogenase [quinone] large subunit